MEETFGMWRMYRVIADSSQGEVLQLGEAVRQLSISKYRAILHGAVDFEIQKEH
jgi:diphthamide synthase (EF-2-diphthine--ammonia ligase)